MAESKLTKPAKPLGWHVPTDHPQDSHEAVCIAHGIGGRYAIDRRDDGAHLLWFAHDEFVFEEPFATLSDAKARAEADWQERFSAQLQGGSEQ